MIAIADYGMGNLRSVQKAFEHLGHRAVLTPDPAALRDAQAVVLPGVGAARDAMRRLESSGLGYAVLDAAARNVPVLGICLGMQLLLRRSYENGCTDCLGIVEGEVVPFEASRMHGLAVPHMGWNDLARTRGLLDGLDGSYVYFVHSYHAVGVPCSQVGAECTYGYPFICAISSGNVHGVQFHPEKSGIRGLTLLKRFAVSAPEKGGTAA